MSYLVPEKVAKCVRRYEKTGEVRTWLQFTCAACGRIWEREIDDNGQRFSVIRLAP